MADELTMLKVHCEAVLRLTTAAVRGMRDRGRGGVVNVASVAAFVPRGTYGASKAWVVQFTQGAARDLAGVGRAADGAVPRFRPHRVPRAGRHGDRQHPRLDVAGRRQAGGRGDSRTWRAARPCPIPDPRYKALMGAVKLAPRGLLGGVTSKTGRKYGPQ